VQFDISTRIASVRSETSVDMGHTAKESSHDPIGSSLIACGAVVARSAVERRSVTDRNPVEQWSDGIAAGLDEYFCTSVSVESGGRNLAEEPFAACPIVRGAGCAASPSSP
jgi:hypothetical protein